MPLHERRVKRWAFLVDAGGNIVADPIPWKDGEGMTFPQAHADAVIYGFAIIGPGVGDIERWRFVTASWLPDSPHVVSAERVS
jgi:hypothetical protein